MDKSQLYCKIKTKNKSNEGLQQKNNKAKNNVTKSKTPLRKKNL